MSTPESSAPQMPSVGRIVWFHRAGVSEPIPAIVTKVWSDKVVNLVSFNAEFGTAAATQISVTMKTEGSTISGWSWPERL